MYRVQVGPWGMGWSPGSYWFSRSAALNEAALLRRDGWTVLVTKDGVPCT